MAYVGSIAAIPLGHLGLLTDVPPSEVPRGALVMSKNISYETGTLTKAPGSSKYNTVALPAGVVAMFDYWPDTVTQRLIVACSNGSIYRDIGDKAFSGNVAIETDLGNLTPNCMFVEAGGETTGRSKKLFFFSMTSQVRVLEGDGTTFSEIDTPAADWVTPNYPKVGIVYRNRLWAFMKQRAYGSDTGDHENFDANDIVTQEIFSGEGGDILGAYVFRGRLFAFKEGGFVYILEDTNDDEDLWYWRKLSSNFGLASPHAIIEVANDMVAVNESGSPTSYAATEAFGDIESADLLRAMQIEEHFRNNTSLSGLNVMHAVYYAAKKQAFFTWRSGYFLNNDMLFHIDFNKQQPRAAFWPKDNADCLALRRDNNKVLRPIYGASDGFVYNMDRENRLVGDSAYQGEFKIGHTDFRFLDEKLANKNKLFDWLAVEYVPQGNWTLYVDVYIDGDFMETITFTMNTRDDGLDTYTLGTGDGVGLETAEGGDGDPLGREETQTEQKPLHGSGRRISFRIRQAGSNQNFNLASLLVGFRVSDEKASKAT